MDKVIKKVKSNIKKYIFTENINYFKAGKSSIWGTGDKETIEMIKNTKITGTWLNLGAGDGRYNDLLLKKANKVVVSDIDEGALSKLYYLTKIEHRSKLDIKVFNILNGLPFENGKFDGIICTGLIYLFPENIINKILSEVKRCLKDGGIFIFDFATDRVKTKLNGNPIYDKRIKYSLSDAYKLIENEFNDFKIFIGKSLVPRELIKLDKKQYYFSCNFLIVKAIKKHS